MINSVLMQDDVQDRAREGVRPSAEAHLRADRVSGHPTSTPCASATEPGPTGSLARGLRGAHRRRPGRAVRVLPRRHRQARGDARLQPRPLEPPPRSGPPAGRPLGTGDVPVLGDVIAPVLEAARARRVVEIGALRGETTAADARAPRPRLRAARDRPGARVRSRRARGAASPAATSSTATSATTSCRPAARRRRADRRRPQLVHRLPRAPAARARRPAPAAPPLPGAGPARRAAGPTAAATSTTTPSASPRSSASPTQHRGMQPGPARSSTPTGGLNPHLRQRRDRRRAPQRRDDRARRLHRRARPAAPAASSCRSTSAWRSWSRRSALAAAPELAARARPPRERPRARHELLELAERIRLERASFEHNGLLQHDAAGSSGRRALPRPAQGRAARRALPRERGPARLPRRLHRGQRQLPTPAPCATRSATCSRDAETPRPPRRSGGTSPTAAADDGAVRSPTPTSAAPASTTSQRCLDAIRAEDVAGDLVECGTAAAAARSSCAAYLDGSRDRRAARSGSPTGSARRHAGRRADRRWPTVLDLRPDLNQVRDGFDRFGLLDERVRFLQGDRRRDPRQAAPIEQIALLRLGADAGDDGRATCSTRSTPGSSPGGFVIVDDDGDPARIVEAVEAFRAAARHRRRRSSGSTGTRSCGARPRRRGRRARPPRAAGASADRVPLARRAGGPTSRPLGGRRLLQHAARGGPHAALAVAVLPARHRRPRLRGIVVENGSAPDQRLGEDFVRSFGPEFRYLDLGARRHAVARRTP